MERDWSDKHREPAIIPALCEKEEKKRLTNCRDTSCGVNSTHQYGTTDTQPMLDAYPTFPLRMQYYLHKLRVRTRIDFENHG